MVKNLPAKQETQVQFLGWEDPLEKEMVIHSSVLAWEFSWTKEPGRIQFMGSLKVKHDLVNNNNKATKCMINFNALEN